MAQDVVTRLPIDDEKMKEAPAAIDWKQRAEAAEEQVSKLQTENAYLKRENEALLSKVNQLSKVMNEELDSARKRIELMQKTPPLPRAKAHQVTDAALCQRFGLPAGDFAVATYGCRDRDSKVKASILPGSSGHSLEFQLADGRVLLFRAFMHRDECVDDIRMLCERVASQRPAGLPACAFYAHGVLEASAAPPAAASAAQAPAVAEVKKP